MLALLRTDEVLDENEPDPVEIGPLEIDPLVRDPLEEFLRDVIHEEDFFRDDGLGSLGSFWASDDSLFSHNPFFLYERPDPPLRTDPLEIDEEDSSLVSQWVDMDLADLADQMEVFDETTRWPDDCQLPSHPDRPWAHLLERDQAGTHNTALLPPPPPLGME